MMNTTLQSKMYKTGYYISLLGTVLIMLWMGGLKFTPTEANGIRPFMENSPFTSWMYKLWSVQTASEVIGVTEMATAIFVILSVRFSKLRLYASLGMTATFLTTVSFLVTTPGIWKVVDGVLVTKFSLIKDLMYLGFGLMLVNFPRTKTSDSTT
jgi:uncharacterized membrane protein YkgB